MKKQLLLMLVFLTLATQVAFADAVPFYKAVDGVNVKAVNKLKREVDRMELQSYIKQKNDLKALKKAIRKYKLGQNLESDLEMEIAIVNIVDKARRANRIKEIGYLVEENATFLGARQLYLGALKAKLDLELVQLIYDNQLAVFEGEKTKLSNGTISETDFLTANNHFSQVVNELSIAKINYDEMYGKLRNFLNNDVEIVVEQPRITPLAPLDYYEKSIDYRFEIEQPRLLTEIIDLDLPFYTKRFLVVPAVKRKYKEMLVDKQGYQLDIERKRYQIKKEIQLALFDIQQDINAINTLSTKLADLRARLTQLQALYDKGVISQQKLADFKVDLKRLENGYYLKSCVINTKRIALGMAASVGPAYEEE